MDGSANFAQYAHFGDFEFNAQAGELCKQGVPVKLQGQPIEILAMLLERQGLLVSREDYGKNYGPAIRMSISTTASTRRSSVCATPSTTTPTPRATSRRSRGAAIASSRASRRQQCRDL